MTGGGLLLYTNYYLTFSRFVNIWKHGNTQETFPTEQLAIVFLYSGLYLLIMDFPLFIFRR